MKYAKISAAIFSVMFVFTGCLGYGYGENEISDIERKGQIIINYNLPEGAKLKSVKALEDFLIGGPHRLTNYAYGEYTLDGEDISYCVNVVTEEIYTSENFTSLEEAVSDLPIKALGFEDILQYEINDISIVLPHDENSELSDCFLQKVLPVGTTDTDTFIASKDRPLIAVNCNLTVPNGEDIYSFTLEKIRSLQNTHGIYFSDLIICNERGTESLHIENNKYESYLRKETVDFKDYLICGTVCQRTERFTNGSVLSETHEYNLYEDITVEKTDNGYRFGYRKELLKTQYRPKFILLANDGAEILKHDYILHPDGANYSTECYWKQRDDKMWVLRAAYGDYSFENKSTEMTVKT